MHRTTMAAVNALCFGVTCVGVGVLYLIEPFWRIRLAWLQEERIGHLACNIDVFARRLQLDGRPPRTSYIFLGGFPASRQLFEMWKRVLTVVDSRFVCRLLYRARALLEKTRFIIDLTVMVDEHREFALAKPNLAFTPAEEEKGRQLLAEMGIGPDDWFVCFHARDPAYIANTKGAAPQPSHRDCSIGNYLAAAEHIAGLGGFAIRMGAVVTEPLPDLGNPRILDYATKFRSDFMDIYLPAKCRFFLGNNSGLFLVTLLFNGKAGTPNWCPLCYVGIGPNHMVAPKLIRDTAQGRILSFHEIKALGLMDTDQAGQDFANAPETYQRLGVELVESDSADVLDMCLDLLDQAEGRPPPEDAAALQRVYARTFFPDHPHSGPHAGPIGPRFTLRHRRLIVEPGH